MARLNKFTNLAAYNAGIGAITKPAVSLIVDTGEVKYNPYVAPTFGGLQIAPGPLYTPGLSGDDVYDVSKYRMGDDWTYSSYGSAAYDQAGSCYHTYTRASQLFSSQGTGKTIDNTKTFNGWRMPLIEDWQKILDTTTTLRVGATVNGNANKHFAAIQLTGITYCGNDNPRGLIVFPDNATITGKALSYFDTKTTTDGFTVSDLNVYLAQGCAFLPFAGFYSNDSSSFSSGGLDGSYWSGTMGSGETQWAHKLSVSIWSEPSYPKALIGWNAYILRLVK